MVEVKKAVSIAIQFIEELYDPSDLVDFMLEEVELSEDERYWIITLGFNRLESPGKHPLDILRVPQYVRVYKKVTVDTGTGEPLSMKIRTVNED